METKQEPVYKVLASAIAARKNCIASANTLWQEKWEAKISDIVNRYFPSGSGFDSGSSIDLEKSTEEKLILYTSFHHMDESGGYDGWTEHTITVTGSLSFGFRLSISGPNRNDIKEYIHEMFSAVLSKTYQEPAPEPEMTGDCQTETLKVMRERQGDWYAYRNEDLSSAMVGHLKFLQVGEGKTFNVPLAHYPANSISEGHNYRLAGKVDQETGKIQSQK